MATQTGVVRLRGTLGDVTFFKTKDGYKVKMKGGPTRNEVKYSRRFARTRESNKEFRFAGKSLRLLKQGLRVQLNICCEKYFYGRLTALLLRVLRNDNVHARGKRIILPENMYELRGFQFKKGIAAGIPIQLHTDVQKGKVQIETGLSPAGKQTAKAAGATHFTVRIFVSDIDFLKDMNTTTVFESPVLSIDAKPLQEIYEHAVPEYDGLVIFCGIEYLQWVNGMYYTIAAVSATEIAGVVRGE